MTVITKYTTGYKPVLRRRQNYKCHMQNKGRGDIQQPLQHSTCWVTMTASVERSSLWSRFVVTPNWTRAKHRKSEHVLYQQS